MTTLRPLRPFLRPLTRTYASQTPGNPVLDIFNRKTKQLQKDRAARNVQESRNVDYIKDEVALRLCERLLDIKRTFPHVLDLGANSCNIARALTTPISDPTASDPNAETTLSNRITNLTCVETSQALLHRDSDLPFNDSISLTREVIPDLESLPYAPNTFDAVLSSLSIHWINDLPSLLAQVNSILKPDCPFIAAMFGGDTLFELRTSLQLADLERRGGVSPHVSPLADVRDVGGLLNKAGFKMLTVDVEDIVVEYPDTFALMGDLQAMGENNAIMQREAGPISRDVLLANEAIYRQLHKEEGDRGIPATFRLIYMIGWKEGEGQSKPLARGSGDVNLKDILGGGDFRP
ncbi:S-adenosyl-L-methionine-dependent methyltransferase [Aspergillus cavernicola]|uniref:S-adenosyl-L-methionine-dependent methyltransferase n=1 Tax=Aspergillus cavernicola TaxID=176166 RepID=A0ABR4IH38_9EURO